MGVKRLPIVVVCCALAMGLAVSLTWLAGRGSSKTVVQQSSEEVDKGMPVTDPDFPLPAPPESIEAKGVLTLRAELPSSVVPPQTERDYQKTETAVESVLAAAGAAPISGVNFRRSVIPLGDQLLAPLWRATADTPGIPPPPEGLAECVEGGWWLSLRACGMGAAVYAPCHPPGGRCSLFVDVRRDDEQRPLQRELADDLHRVHGSLVPFDDGRGLLVDLCGYTGELDGLRYAYRLYVCRAPDWQPDMIHSWASPPWEFPGHLEGVTPQGDTAFLIRREGSEAAGTTLSLLRLEVTHGMLSRVARDIELAGVVGLIPSPHGHFLAAQRACEFDISSPEENPLLVIDVASGTTHPVTDRDSPGFYFDTALAWSASVPGRLFFADSDARVWQLDLELAGSLRRPTAGNGQ
jgi:hypothetical protein